MREAYAVLSYDHEVGGLLGCELFRTKEDACKRLKRIVTTECWACLMEAKNIKKIDNVVSKRDLVIDSSDEENEEKDFELCDYLGIEVGKDWTWARTFDSAYSVTENLFVVQMVDLPKGE